jgi:hypothetical protein
MAIRPLTDVPATEPEKLDAPGRVRLGPVSSQPALERRERSFGLCAYSASEEGIARPGHDLAAALIVVAWLPESP